jgi:hypothetical protein
MLLMKLSVVWLDCGLLIEPKSVIKFQKFASCSLGDAMYRKTSKYPLHVPVGIVVLQFG